MKRLAGFVAVAATAAMFACGDDSNSDLFAGASPDAGASDSGKDARGSTTVDPNDSGEQDAGTKQDAGSADGGSADGGSADGGSDPTPTSVWLSEVFADPPGTDGNNEFVELRCQPALALAPYWFVIVDADTINGVPANPGTVIFKKKLTGITCGASGYVVLQRGSVYDGVAGTTYVNSFFADNIQNGAQTYLLVQNETFDPADIDNNDDGVIDDAAWLPKIVDSVAVSDGNVGDKAYSNVVLGGVATDAIARFSNKPARAASSWYFGATMSNPMAPPTFIYDAAGVSANFPVGGALTPGAANSASPL